MHHNHKHCKDMTQSLLIYTEQQQRLCACAATHIRHTHIHCKGTTQLLRIYKLAWCSKSIDFPIFRPIYTHCNHTQSSNSAWLNVELVYNIHTYTAKTWLSFCTSTRSCDAVNQSIFRIIRSIYMHRNHIHCKDTTQSLLIYTEWQQHLYAYAATNIRHSHNHCEGTTQLLRTYTSVQCSKLIDFSVFWSIYMRRKYIDQSSFSSFSWVIIQRTWKLTSKWSAFIYINQSSFSSLNLMIIQTS